jgi:hypothetical protein
MAEDDHQSQLLICAAGVGGVMALCGLKFGRRDKIGRIRRSIASSVASYWYSRYGGGQDWDEFEGAHLKKYERVPSWPTFFRYAQKAVDIILETPSPFSLMVAILETQRFISESNFHNLVNGRPFDEQENNLAKSLRDLGLIIGEDGQIRQLY